MAAFYYGSDDFTEAEYAEMLIEGAAIRREMAIEGGEYTAEQWDEKIAAENAEEAASEAEYNAPVTVSALPNYSNQPFSREPYALAAKCKAYGLTVRAGGNPRDGYCIFGAHNGRAIFFRTPAQVHAYCRSLSALTKTETK